MFEHGPRIHYVKTSVKGISKSQPIMCIAVRRIDDCRVQVGISVRSPSEKIWDKKRMRKIALGRCNNRVSMSTVEYNVNNLKLNPEFDYPEDYILKMLDFLAPMVGPSQYVPRLKRETKLMNLSGIFSIEHYCNTIGMRRLVTAI